MLGTYTASKPLIGAPVRARYKPTKRNLETLPRESLRNLKPYEVGRIIFPNKNNTHITKK